MTILTGRGGVFSQVLQALPSARTWEPPRPSGLRKWALACESGALVRVICDSVIGPALRPGQVTRTPQVTRWLGLQRRVTAAGPSASRSEPGGRPGVASPAWILEGPGPVGCELRSSGLAAEVCCLYFSTSSQQLSFPKLIFEFSVPFVDWTFLCTPKMWDFFLNSCMIL